MKKTICILIIIVAVLLVGCDSKISSNNEDVVNLQKYSINDFNSIIVGESTFYDVNKIAPSECMEVTSYGGVCKYLTEGDQYILIKFYGSELVVGSIETSK